jgi:regulator of replication initiation timing
MVRRNLPLHKKLKNMYQQNMTLRKENKTLKQKLQHLEIEEKGKLDLLAKEIDI